MKKVICKVEYDTDAATIVEKRTFGEFGDPAGYEETLYVSESGKFFLYVNGGADSVYPKEDIKRLSAAKADEWKSAK
jgi:hypothetical protein